MRRALQLVHRKSAAPTPVGAAAIGARAWEDDRIRAEGSRTMVEAALRQDVGRLVQEAVSFIYPDCGDLVEQGSMYFVAALVASTLGSVLGAAVLYEAGRHGGRPLVLRYAKVQWLRTYGIVMPLTTTGPSV